MRPLTSKEYLAIFFEEGLERSPQVRYYEGLVKLFQKKSDELSQQGDSEAYKYLMLAEDAKWIAIMIAEDEKKARE
ncbi:hypothetical protein [Enterococcus dispar]|uniref:hypothetical protein n=1 Tax=Enterococcus dispar TaxID=44009 RepID=UPI002490CF97|nr:hypothetical protein [Enterococcus dispar]